MFRIAVLASGRGTNLQALLDAQARGDLGDASIQLVLSDIPDANALTRAQDAGVEARFIDPEGLSREAYDRELVAAIGDEIDLVVLAGFMRILSPTFLSSFPRRIVNIHPSLLPSFPGLHAQRQALEAGARIAGATTHFVDEEVDQGPIILQGAVPVLPDDTVETLSERILTVEHRILPATVALLASGRVQIEDGAVQIKGGIGMPEPYELIPEVTP